MQFLQSIKDKKTTERFSAIRYIYIFLTLVFCALFLSGCGSGSSGSSQKNIQVATKSVAPVQNAVAPTIAPVQAAPSAVDTLKALAPNKGIKTARLFDTPVRNTDARVDRLENTVQQIKDDFDAVTPAVVRLVAIEKDIQGLIGQLETLVGEEPSQPASAYSPTPITPRAAAQAAQTEQASQMKKPGISVQSATTALPKREAKPETAPVRAVAPSPAPAPASTSTSTSTLSPAVKMAAPTQVRATMPTVKSEPFTPQDNAEAAKDFDVITAVTTKAISTEDIATSKAAALDVRIAERADATQLLIPLPTTGGATATLSADGRRLMVQLKEKWRGKMAWSSEFSPLVASYTVANTDANPLMTINLHFASKLVTSKLQQAGAGKQLIVELQSDAIHFP